MQHFSCDMISTLTSHFYYYNQICCYVNQIFEDKRYGDYIGGPCPHSHLCMSVSGSKWMQGMGPATPE